jgi:hypothetical protein
MPIEVTVIVTPPHGLDVDGVGVGVGVGVLVGVGDGETGTKQSKMASKSNVKHGSTGGAGGVTHNPGYPTVTSKSGSELVLAKGPN